MQKEQLKKQITDDDIKKHDGIIRLLSKGFPNNGSYTRADFFQEGRLAAFLALKSYDPTKGKSLKQWVKYKAKTQMLNFWRKQERIKSHDVYALRPSDANPQTITEVLETLESIDSKKRFILLRRMEGYVNSDIAVLLKCSEQNVHDHLQKVRRDYDSS